MINQGWVYKTPRLTVTLLTSNSRKVEECLIDSGAEANVISIDRLKSIGCPILTLDSKVRFRTASRELVGFEEVALINIEVAEGIGCKTLFFLVKHTPTTLLG